jgi:hypothetical protein
MYQQNCGRLSIARSLLALTEMDNTQSAVAEIEFSGWYNSFESTEDVPLSFIGIQADIPPPPPEQQDAPPASPKAHH